MKSVFEDYSYKSLPGLTLKNIEVRRCTKCDEYEVLIPRIQKLDDSIARMLIDLSRPLRSTEIVFLRKYLGWSGTDFAKNMGVTPETVSRWEHGKNPMSEVADRLLRMCVVNETPIQDYHIEDLSIESVDATQKGSFEAAIKTDGWSVHPRAA